MNKKRGLSTVVTMLIVILLVLVAVGILWVVVKNLISSKSEQIDISGLTLDMQIKQVVVEGDSVLVTVKRNPGKGNLVGIKFIFEKEDGTTEASEEDLTDEPFGELTTRKFTFEFGSGVVDDFVKVSIAPIYKFKKGKSQTGRVLHSKKIKAVSCENDVDCGTYEKCVGGFCELKTCGEIIGGSICVGNEVCSLGNFVEAFDTNLCCVGGTCEEPLGDCDLTNAYWDVTNFDVYDGTIITLKVEGTNCEGTVGFELWEDDFGGNELIDTVINDAGFIGSTATTTWITEWHDDETLFSNNPPEYYFVAKIGSEEINSGTSNEEELKVYSCGDGIQNPEYGEDCDTCPADYPLSGNEVCCFGIIYNGECCDETNCQADEYCELFTHTCEPTGPVCDDGDGDGYGVCPNCGVSAGCIYDGNDCDDSNININPGATEICDYVDNDCDGTINEWPPVAYDACEIKCQGAGYVWLGTKCCGDDFYETEYLTGETSCTDTYDNDCDGLIDGVDSDCGGTVSCGDNICDSTENPANCIYDCPSIGTAGAYSHQNEPLEDYYIETYGNDWDMDTQFIIDTSTKLADLNMNTVGGIVGEDGANYLTQLSSNPHKPYFIAALRLESLDGGIYNLPGLNYPDMSPEFKAAAEARIAVITSKVKNNPYLIGYFPANEIGYIEASDELVEEFTIFVAQKVKEYDPDHYVFSDRVGGVTDFEPYDAVRKVQAYGNFDVIAINLYPYSADIGYADWQLRKINEIYEIAGKPIIITEAGIAHGEAQVPTIPSRWLGRFVDTDAERGVIYENMINQLFVDRDYVVGLHYYIWSDVDESFGGEEVGCGIVKNDFTYYENMANSIRTKNAQIDTTRI